MYLVMSVTYQNRCILNHIIVSSPYRQVTADYKVNNNVCRHVSHIPEQMHFEQSYCMESI